MVRNRLLILLLLSYCSADAQINSAPMSCKIKGVVVSVLPKDKAEKKSLCSKYRCKAKVRVLQVLHYGSSMSAMINNGDTIEVMFAYTLHATLKLFPGMKVKYPGLQIGNVFIANVEQRLKPGLGSQFTVYGYELSSNLSK